jgi:putative colanic acid biosynthesis UDP-glucose lipid carrier transferase
MNLPDGRSEVRRRQRFQFPSRTFLALGIGAIETLVVVVATLLLAWIVPLSAAVLMGLTAGLVHGYLASRAARNFLIHADARQPFVLHAALSWLGAAALAGLVGLALTAARPLPPSWTIWLWLLGTSVIVVVLRVVLYRQIGTMMRHGQLQVERIALVGEAEAVQRYRQEAKVWQHGGQIIASLILDADFATNPPSADTVREFAQHCLANKCEHILIVGGVGDLALIDAIVQPCRPYAVNVMLYSPTHQGRPATMAETVPLGPNNALRLLSAPVNDSGRLLKRAFDIAGALVGLALLSPVMLGLAAIIRLTSAGPALYSQERRGFNGQSFKILKFRSMTVMEDGNAMTQARPKDPRITPIGHIIRRTSLDELPQLINVLRGDMSLVGPRPHAISHDAELSHKFDLYAERQRIRPGITGWAQVNGYRGDTSTQEKIEGRTLHDLYYVENWSLLLDCWIILLTIFSHRTRQNAL